VHGSAAPAGQTTPNPLLRKQFSLHGGIASARAYTSGLGFYQLFINGRRVGDHVLDPAFTDYNKTVDYVTYGVTRELRPGPNAVGVSLGNGWYSGNADHFSIPAAVPWQPAQPKLKFELDMRYADGSSAQVLSDTSWMTADGPTTADNVQCEDALTRCRA
jgi:alpha-L-rhamnosidase